MNKIKDYSSILLQVLYELTMVTECIEIESWIQKVLSRTRLAFNSKNIFSNDSTVLRIISLLIVWMKTHYQSADGTSSFTYFLLDLLRHYYVNNATKTFSCFQMIFVIHGFRDSVPARKLHACC